MGNRKNKKLVFDIQGGSRTDAADEHEQLLADFEPIRTPPPHTGLRTIRARFEPTRRPGFLKRLWSWLRRPLVWLRILKPKPRAPEQPAGILYVEREHEIEI